MQKKKENCIFIIIVSFAYSRLCIRSLEEGWIYYKVDKSIALSIMSFVQLVQGLN